jgi:hypothetical protein
MNSKSKTKTKSKTKLHTKRKYIKYRNNLTKYRINKTIHKQRGGILSEPKLDHENSERTARTARTAREVHNYSMVSTPIETKKQKARRAMLSENYVNTLKTDISHESIKLNPNNITGNFEDNFEQRTALAKQRILEKIAERDEK